MKRFIKYFSAWMLSSIILIAACKKAPVVKQPGNDYPGQVSGSKYIRFVVENLPGETTVVNGLNVLVTILNEQNQLIMSDRLLPLQFKEKYITDSIEIPAGSFKLSKFFIVGEDHKTLFVTPMVNSPKASQVQKPLYLPFSIPKPVMTSIEPEILRVEAADQPGPFGYPDGSFNNDSVEPGIKKIWIHPVLKVGDIIYDSVPVSFTLTSWDANGQMTAKKTTLAAGKSELSLSASMAKYHFKIVKWGITDELTVLQNDLVADTTYTLGGSKTAKKLISELSYKLVDGTYKPFSKHQYEYDGNSKLQKIIYQLKRPDNTSYIARSEYIAYENGKVSSIMKYDEFNAIMMTTEFSYNNAGAIASIKHNESGSETRGTVEYTSLPWGTDISQQHNIQIKYRYSDRYYTMDYNKEFQGGVMVRDAMNTSHHSSELGLYQYDFRINPYIHLKLPDLFLTYNSKHNVTWQQKSYHATLPEFEPYEFDYTYDTDDYPKELITKYRSALTYAHAYTMKTVYNY